MRLIIAALIFLASPTMSAFAEDDAMEAQRCIWRCLANSKGADDPAYNACIKSDCDGEPASSKAGSDRDASAPWTYGLHPKLGMAAYVDIGDEAFGLACNALPPNSASTSVASLRMTPGLASTATQQLAAVTVFIQPFEVGGAGTFQPNVLGFVEIIGDACATDVKQLQTSKTLLFLREKFVSLNLANNANVLTVEKEGHPVSITSRDDLNSLAKATAVPLSGSTAAIDRLLKACPAIRRQMAEGCMGGH